MLVSRSVKFPFHCICQRTVLNNRKCENETYTWKMVLRVLQLLYWITAVCSVLPSACTVHHVSSKTHACLSRTGAHVSVREVRSPDDVTGFKVVTDRVRSNLIKMCWFEMWLLVALPPHRRRHLMLLHLKPNVFIAAAAFTWSSCLSLTAGVSFLLLHFVPVLFTFCWILPSADTVLCLCAVFEMTHNAKCWLNWEALSVHCPPSCVIVSAGWVLVQGSGGGVIWMKRDWWPLIHINKAFYTQVLKDHFTQNHTNHCPLMP